MPTWVGGGVSVFYLVAHMRREWCRRRGGRPVVVFARRKCAAGDHATVSHLVFLIGMVVFLPNGRSDSSLALSEVTQFPRRSDDVFVEVSAEGRGGPVSHKAAAALDVSATTVSIDTASPGRGTVDGYCTKPTRTQRAVRPTAELAAAVARSPSEQEASLLPPLNSPGEAEPVALNRTQVCGRDRLNRLRVLGRCLERSCGR